MVNFGPLAAEIDPVVRGTPANFNGFRVLTALLHGTPHSSHSPRKVALNSVKTIEQLLWFPMQERSFFGSY